MVMHMMCIGHMRMRVPQRSVSMAVAVLADRHRVVDMLVMGVVMPMRVLMIQRLVRVLMAMGLGQMQDHPGQHQHAAQGHRPAG